MKQGTFSVLRGVLVALALVMLPIAPARAQESGGSTATLPDPLTPDAIQALVSRLSDREVRDLLLQELDARAEATTTEAVAQPSLANRIAQPLRIAAERIVQSAATAPEKSAALAAALDNYFQSLGSAGTLQLAAALAAALVVGIAIDRAYARRMGARAAMGPASSSDAPAIPSSIPFQARRLLRDAGGALLALAVAAAMLGIWLPERETGVAMSVVLWLVFFPRLAWVVLHFFLSPDRPDQRLLVTDDWTARALTRYLVGLLIGVGAMQTILHVAHEVGASETAQSVGFWFNVIIFVLLAVIFIVCRAGLRSIVRGRQTQLTRNGERLVFAYPAFAVVVIALTWIAGVLAAAIGKEDVVRDGRHLLGLALLLIAPMCDTLIRAAVRFLLPPMHTTGSTALEAQGAVWQSYVNIARVLVFGGLVLVLASLWEISLSGSAARGEPSSEWIFEVLLILLVGYIALEVANIVINRALANEKSDGVDSAPQEIDEGPASGGVASRLGTILPPVSWALRAAIIAVTVLTALSQVGINVTALLAGAGVVGIAIGFGAQKLVADVISGLFFLVDDAFRLNEYIEVGGIEGTVERIGLRSILLRHSNGAIQCVPYSNISSISNLGRDWGTMKQVFTVPFDTDIEKVRKIFKKIGQDLLENPEVKDAFIQPFKYKGVSQVNDVGIVVRGKFMFKPELAKQFLIQREIYRRVHADFANAGIRFARREVRVSVDTDGAPLTEAAAKSIGATAAASEAVSRSVAEAEQAAARQPKPGT